MVRLLFYEQLCVVISLNERKITNILGPDSTSRKDSFLFLCELFILLFEKVQPLLALFLLLSPLLLQILFQFSLIIINIEPCIPFLLHIFSDAFAAARSVNLLLMLYVVGLW